MKKSIYYTYGNNKQKQKLPFYVHLCATNPQADSMSAPFFTILFKTCFVELSTLL